MSHQPKGSLSETASLSGDLWGGIAAMLVALPSSIAFGVLVYTILGSEYIGQGAMAGAIGGGGLGNLAITRGYNRFQNDVTLVATIIILIIVFISQAIGNALVKKVSH